MDQAGMIEERPLPARTAFTAEFWDGLAESRLRVPRCSDCGVLQFPPEPTCCACGGAKLAWQDLSGRGWLYSWTVCHPPLLPYFARYAPWPVVAVELEEGVRMISTLKGLEPCDYKVGLRVSAVYESIGDGMSLLAFQPEARS
jgi:uncharacterized protein